MKSEFVCIEFNILKDKKRPWAKSPKKCGKLSLFREMAINLFSDISAVI